MTSTAPFWKGRLFAPSIPVAEDGDIAPARRAETYGPLVSLRLEALPFSAEVEAAAAARPEAGEDLKYWADAWNSSFPLWERDALARRGRLANLDRTTGEDPAAAAVAGFLAAPRSEHDYIDAYQIEGLTRASAERERQKDDPALSLARTLRAARAFRAGSRLKPFCTSFEVLSDGRPAGSAILAETGEAPKLQGVTGEDAFTERADRELAEAHARARFVQPDFDYWNWGFVRPFLDRTVVGWAGRRYVGDRPSHGSDFENRQRRLVIAGALADLAAHGEHYAVVTPREVNGHKGSTLVDLKGIATIHDALRTVEFSLPGCAAVTVERQEGYLGANRYFFHDGLMLGSTRLDPLATPYDRDPAEALDHTVSMGTVARPNSDGANSLADTGGHDDYAFEVASALTENGFRDFTLDLGLFTSETSPAGVIETYRLLSIGDLWSADFLSLDPAFLFDGLAGEFSDYDTRLADLVTRLVSEHEGIPRLAGPFLEAVEAYGRFATVAHLVARSVLSWSGPWKEGDVSQSLLAMMAHFAVFVASERDDALHPYELEWAEDLVPDLSYGGFHNWLWRSKEAEAIVAGMEAATS